MSILRMITYYSTLQSADSSEGILLLLLTHNENSIRFKNQCQIEREQKIHSSLPSPEILRMDSPRVHLSFDFAKKNILLLGD